MFIEIALKPSILVFARYILNQLSKFLYIAFSLKKFSTSWVNFIQYYFARKLNLPLLSQIPAIVDSCVFPTSPLIQAPQYHLAPSNSYELAQTWWMANTELKQFCTTPNDSPRLTAPCRMASASVATASWFIFFSVPPAFLTFLHFYIPRHSLMSHLCTTLNPRVCFSEIQSKTLGARAVPEKENLKWDLGNGSVHPLRQVSHLVGGWSGNTEQLLLFSVMNCDGIPV